jgi:predicted Holliday junction resolvase-like endonuclease
VYSLAEDESSSSTSDSCIRVASADSVVHGSAAEGLDVGAVDGDYFADDCSRFEQHTYEPIDLIAFNGLGKGEVSSLDFIEIKTGKARLNEHEKAVKEAVEAGKVEYKVIK